MQARVAALLLLVVCFAAPSLQRELPAGRHLLQNDPVFPAGAPPCTTSTPDRPNACYNAAGTQFTCCGPLSCPSGPPGAQPRCATPATAAPTPPPQNPTPPAPAPTPPPQNAIPTTAPQPTYAAGSAKTCDPTSANPYTCFNEGGDLFTCCGAPNCPTVPGPLPYCAAPACSEQPSKGAPCGYRGFKTVTYTVPLPATLGGKNYPLSLGFGSSGDTGDREDEYYFIGDRGPNIDCSMANQASGNPNFCTDTSGTVFPVPNYPIQIFKFSSLFNGPPAFTPILLKNSAGGNVLGLTNPPPLGDGAPNGNDGKVLPFDPSGLDTECLARYKDPLSGQTRFVIGEEYGPSFVITDEAGKVLNRFLPNNPARENAAVNSATYPTSLLSSFPSVVALRRSNRGVESCAISNNAIFYFALQSALDNPDNKARRTATTIRIFKVNLAVTPPVFLGEYVYTLTPVNDYSEATYVSTSLGDLKLSELKLLDKSVEDVLVVLERNTDETKLFRVDLRGATNILDPTGAGVDAPGAQSAALDQGPVPAGIVPAAKTLIFDTGSKVQNTPFASKIETLIVLKNKNQIVLANDNDFGITGEVSTFYLIDVYPSFFA